MRNVLELMQRNEAIDGLRYDLSLKFVDSATVEAERLEIAKIMSVLDYYKKLDFETVKEFVTQIRSKFSLLEIIF